MIDRNRRRPRGKPDRNRALELLVASRDGCTEAVMLAHGFTISETVDGRRTQSARV
jgi:hypothetical protein